MLTAGMDDTYFLTVSRQYPGFQFGDYLGVLTVSRIANKPSIPMLLVRICFPGKYCMPL